MKWFRIIKLYFYIYNQSYINVMIILLCIYHELFIFRSIQKVGIAIIMVPTFLDINNKNPQYFHIISYIHIITRN